MTTKYRVFRLVLSLVLTVLSLVVVSAPSASALTLDYNVQSYWAGSVPYSTLWGTSEGNYAQMYVCAGGTDYRTTISRLLVTFDNNIASSVQSGDIFELNLSGTSDGNANVNLDFAINLYDAYNNFDVIDVNYSSAGLSAAKFQIILMAKRAGVTSVDLRRTGGFPFTSMSKAGGGLECIATGNWTAYHPVGNGSQAIVDAINNNNDTQAINDAKREIVGAIEQQQQTQQDIHDDEKDTIQDSVDEAQDSADSVDTSGFTFGNPFSAWFGLFVDDTCVNIPVLASWVNSNETRICSPWSGTDADGHQRTNVREYATPVVSVLSLTIVFGFLINWLKGNTDVGLENT